MYSVIDAHTERTEYLLLMTDFTSTSL